MARIGVNQFVLAVIFRSLDLVFSPHELLYSQKERYDFIRFK